MKKKTGAAGESALDVVEEAVHLLRGAPASLHGVYALGTLPFILGFLYFWADMSRGAFARDHADRAAVAMALLFLWMKFWHAIFAAGVRAQRTGQPDEPWTTRRIWAVALTQSALQPSGLFVLPVALAIMLPFPWAFAFYQNITAIGSSPGGLRETGRLAARQASVRQMQNNLLQGIQSVFVFFIWVNVVISMAWLPHLFKSVLGLDTAFTQAGWRSVLNTTYLACSFALAYVFVDPLVKTIFVLRSFYGLSLRTGEDLKSDLARARSARALAASVLAVLMFFVLTVLPASAATNAPPAATISPGELNQSIDKVLQKPEFAWRMPREAARDSDPGRHTWLERFIGSISDMVEDAAKYCLEGLGKSIRSVVEWIVKMWPWSKPATPDAAGGLSTLASALQILLFVLIAIIAALLGVMIFRLWRQRRKTPGATAAPVVKTRPDLNDENVAADQLPEEGWLGLAREMMARGDLRLALRAFYLAGLANLASRGLIAIAVFKSNREYEAELRRRARVQPVTQTAFSQNVAAFDRAWYGLHEVTQEALQEFQSNLERIRS